MKYINMKNPLIFQKMIYFGQIKSDIFHSTDMSWRRKLLRTPIGPLPYQFQSKPNQNRGSNPIFSSPNFTKSEITFFSFCSGFQALSIFLYGSGAEGIHWPNLWLIHAAGFRLQDRCALSSWRGQQRISWSFLQNSPYSVWAASWSV